MKTFRIPTQNWIIFIICVVCVVWFTLIICFFDLQRATGRIGRSDTYPSASSPVRRVWVLKEQLNLITKSSQEIGTTVTLYPGNIVIGEYSGGGLSISYPTSGWASIEDLGVLAMIEDIQNNSLQNSRNDPCSGYLTFSTSIQSLDAMLSWQNQLPIGNGRIGALVGGSFIGTIFPLSSEGFYVHKEFQDESIIQNNENYFNLSRQHLINGEFEESQRVFSSVIRKKTMGMFQSLGDLTILYDFNVKSSTNRLRYPHLTGRKKVLAQLQEKVNRAGIWKDLQHLKLLYERNFLNTREGVASSVHVLSNNQSNTPSFHVHSRTWFASIVDEVIVGKIDCTREPVSSKGCLNLALQFSHEQSSTVTFRYSSWDLRRRESSLKGHKTNAIALSASIPYRLSESESNPGAEVCGILVCTSGIKIFDNFVSCMDTRDATVILHIILSNQNKNMTLLSQDCWAKIENALDLGYDTLYARHVAAFASNMGETSMCLGSESLNLDHSCSGEVDSHLNCFRDSYFQDQNTILNPYLLNSVHLFSKYLLFSAGRIGVSNLQGIWADGPTSAWNGDYHLNINLQMTYWPAYAMGISEQLIPPFLGFINKLVRSGYRTAQKLYGCEGWVIHAFTDDKLDAGILGDLEWSLCVTCGVWLTLHLWDSLTYDFDILFLVDIFLPIFRSLAKFFLQYMFLGPDGNMHTGPTTSPENSYKIGESFHQITLSPAFDMSLLREASNAYSIAINWGLTYAPAESLPDLKLDLDIANSFQNLIYQMINHANPIIHPSSGIIVEYPMRDWKILKSDTTSSYIVEDADPGHRHFSSLHWLYPGMFYPTPFHSRDIFIAAKKTLLSKSTAGGGHTGWSAAWESCLWSRLREPHLAWNALLKIVGRYTGPNLMGLHPALSIWNSDCRTCFTHEINGHTKFARNPSESPRGMVNEESAVFQIDANAGYYAALSEMLIQSHFPNVILLLPSLPKQLSTGVIKNLIVRGGIKVSMDWKHNLVQSVHFLINKWHPWLENIIESRPGYYNVGAYSTLSSTLHIISPNKLYTISHQCFEQLQQIFDYNANVTLIIREDDHISSFKILSYPCEITLSSRSERER